MFSFRKLFRNYNIVFILDKTFPMKKIIIITTSIFCSICFAQDNSKYAVYPGCQKYQTNEELKNYFSLLQKMGK